MESDIIVGEAVAPRSRRQRNLVEKVRVVVCVNAGAKGLYSRGLKEFKKQCPCGRGQRFGRRFSRERQREE